LASSSNLNEEISLKYENNSSYSFITSFSALLKNNYLNGDRLSSFKTDLNILIEHLWAENKYELLLKVLMYR
jgi:hypothetical protein